MSEEIRLTLRPVPRAGGNPTLRLRALLKVALRSFGFRCTLIEGAETLDAKPQLTEAEQRQRAIEAVFGPKPAQRGNQALQPARPGAPAAADDLPDIQPAERGSGSAGGLKSERTEE